jgi:hypothetical protein
MIQLPFDVINKILGYYVDIVDPIWVPKQGFNKLRFELNKSKLGFLEKCLKCKAENPPKIELHEKICFSTLEYDDEMEAITFTLVKHNNKEIYYSVLDDGFCYMKYAFLGGRRYNNQGKYYSVANSYDVFNYLEFVLHGVLHKRYFVGLD